MKSCVDEAVAIIALFFETITFKLCQLPNCMFALHLFATTVVRRDRVPAPIRGLLNCVRRQCA